MISVFISGLWNTINFAFSLGDTKAVAIFFNVSSKHWIVKIFSLTPKDSNWLKSSSLGENIEFGRCVFINPFTALKNLSLFYQSNKCKVDCFLTSVFQFGMLPIGLPTAQKAWLPTAVLPLSVPATCTCCAELGFQSLCSFLLSVLLGSTSIGLRGVGLFWGFALCFIFTVVMVGF